MEGRIITKRKKPPRVRKSHVVSRFYLAKFARPDGRLYVYERDKAPRISIPEKEAVERDYFEPTAYQGAEQNQTEEWLGRIEDDAGRVFNTIVAAQQIQGQDAGIWSTFVASLFLRSRKVRYQLAKKSLERLREECLAPEYLRELQSDMLQIGEFVFFDALRQHAERTLAKFESDPAFSQVTALENTTVSLAQSLLKKAWHTVDAPEELFFLTSDCPVITVKLDSTEGELGHGFERENVAVMLPLTPRKLFIASPPHMSWRKTLQPNGVLAANASIIRFAHRNVYSHVNVDIIRKLVDAEMNQVKYGENAFVQPLARE